MNHGILTQWHTVSSECTATTHYTGEALRQVLSEGSQTHTTTGYLMPFAERSRRGKVHNGDTRQQSIYFWARRSQWWEGAGVGLLEAGYLPPLDLQGSSYVMCSFLEICHTLYSWPEHSSADTLFFNKLYFDIILIFVSKALTPAMLGSGELLLLHLPTAPEPTPTTTPAHITWGCSSARLSVLSILSSLRVTEESLIGLRWDTWKMQSILFQNMLQAVATEVPRNRGIAHLDGIFQQWATQSISA